MKITWCHIFLQFSLIIGFVLVFIIPPMQVPDENTHFLNAYAFSEGDWFPSSKDEAVGRVFPRNVMEYVTMWNTVDTEKTTIETVMQDSVGEINSTDAQFYEYWASDTNMVGYIISGTGMFLAKLFSGGSIDCYNLLLVGRIANLLFYIFTIYYAIKICPYFEKLITLIALMPMSFYLASSLSYDSILIPTCILLFALAVKIKLEHIQVTKHWFIIMVILSIILFNVKMVYSPLLLVLAFIPSKQFGNGRKKFVSAILVISIGLTILILHYAVLNHLPTTSNSQSESVQTAQRAFVLSNPLQFGMIILNTFKMFLPSFLKGFVGALGNFTLQLPKFLLVSYASTLLITAIYEGKNGEIINISHKIVLGIALVAIVYLSFAGMYIGWTSIRQGVGVNWVDGIQGRYFIPMSIFTVLLISHDGKITFGAKLLNEVIFYLLTITWILVCIFILLRFWT